MTSTKRGPEQQTQDTVGILSATRQSERIYVIRNLSTPVLSRVDGADLGIIFIENNLDPICLPEEFHSPFHSFLEE